LVTTEKSKLIKVITLYLHQPETNCPSEDGGFEGGEALIAQEGLCGGSGRPLIEGIPFSRLANG